MTSLNAYGFALGRRAGSATSRFHPRNEAMLKILLSRLDLRPEIRAGWREGLGYALGENWGPACIPHAREQSDPLLLKGCIAGTSFRWLTTDP